MRQYKNNSILKFAMFNARITNVTMRRTFEGYIRVHNVPTFLTNYINIKIIQLFKYMHKDYSSSTLTPSYPKLAFQVSKWLYEVKVTTQGRIKKSWVAGGTGATKHTFGPYMHQKEVGRKINKLTTSAQPEIQVSIIKAA